MNKAYIACSLLLLVIFPAISSGDQKSVPGTENTLGLFKLGDSEAQVAKRLPAMKDVNHAGMYYQDNWTVWIDQKKKVLNGISYNEAKNINSESPYPKTSRLITIGSTLQTVEKTYGSPDKILAGRSPFVLRNSELALIYIYPTTGLWLEFTNQTPYSTKYDWRVTFVVVGNNDVIKHMLVGAPAYATTPIAQDKKSQIVAMYENKYGKAEELDKFDDYMFNLQVAIFDKIKTLGRYVISPIMIIPEDEKKANEVLAELSQDRPQFTEIQSQAKKKTLLKYKISAQQLDRIISNIEKLKMDLFTKEAQSNNL